MLALASRPRRAKVSPRPERISISVSISSPAAADGEQLVGLARRRRARRSRARARASTGSTIANSSSSPTVKSVEASNASRVRSRLRSARARRCSPAGRSVLGQVEVERVEEVDGGAGGVHRDLGRDVQQLLGVVEDDLDAGLHEPVGHLLRRARRERRAPRRRRPPRRRPARGRRTPAPGRRPARWPTCSGSTSKIATIWKPWSAKMSELAIAWPRCPAPNSAMLCWPEVRRILRISCDQRIDPVADAPLAELPEPREVAPDLGRVDVRVLGELLRGDRLLAHLPGLDQDLEVAARGAPRRRARGARRQSRSPPPVCSAPVGPLATPSTLMGASYPSIATGLERAPPARAARTRAR